LNENKTVNHRKQVNGEYEKIKEGRYSSGLVNLMERIDGCGIIEYYYCLILIK
jgi:hypothetical protein